MTELEKRNEKILQMLKEGVSRRKIGRAFGLTGTRITGIEQETAAEKAMVERRASLLEQIRKADDLKKKWRVADLVDAFVLMSMTTNALLHHYEQAKRKEITLEDLMELIISEIPDGRPGFLITPLLSIRSVGEKGFWNMVCALAETDLGRRCNQEWSRRLEKLKRASRIHGTAAASWTKSCEAGLKLLKAK